MQHTEHVVRVAGEEIDRLRAENEQLQVERQCLRAENEQLQVERQVR